MHRKFKEKILLEDLLNSIEDNVQEIHGIYETACLIENYIQKNSNIKEIKNMLYLIQNFKNNLFYVYKEFGNIVYKTKYEYEDFIEKVKRNINQDDIVFDED